ncbi:S-layer homology domain-containing protein [Neobacillus sp. D3-1R]|uniref:S-layer homology domain-containing protein n=1 Tax=Neobacillus sp. D3-1R TaxID=3445778 RepID=UPI003F9F66EE
MKSKVYVILITFIISILLSSQPTEAKSFADVTQYESEIGFLTQRGIIKGYNSEFRPKSPIKRLQAVQMILREKQGSLGGAPNPGLMDMKPGDYGYEEVAKAIEMGFIGGKTDPKTGKKYFDPNGTLTRAQMSKILAIAYGLSGIYPGDFSDVPKDNWAHEYVEALAKNNITTGYPGNVFKPNLALSRQHFALFMARMLNDEFKPLPDFQVHFLDVGQGDSILVLFPDGKNMLVDGGKKEMGNSVVQYLKAQGIQSLDLVVSTHPDADHLGGLLAVLANIPVKAILDSGNTHTTETYSEYLQLIQQKGIPVSVAKEGQLLDYDKRVKVEVLNSGDANEESNEASIVLKLSMGTIDFLLTADAEAPQEAQMVQTYNVEAEILKAGHHGSQTSTSALFLDEVRPKVAILSYGLNNQYGHPHKEVLDRLLQWGTSIYSTAQSGTIVVKTNGSTYDVLAHPWQYAEKTDEIEETQPKLETKPSYETGNLIITGLDLGKETVSIKNKGSNDVTMTGWKLVSVNGNQTFPFPEGYELKAGQSVTITAGPNAYEKRPSILLWTTKYIWNNSSDSAKLYDPFGKLIYAK